MPHFVMSTDPRIPNPVNPVEDFADRWSEDPQLEENFWKWHAQAKSDLASLQTLTESQLERLISKRFELDYRRNTNTQPAEVAAASIPPVNSKPSRVNITTPPIPWGA